MMIYDDVRRCRRCKRRRMDDEPPEVQQYKTCAKCRIIERTKKKLRKPLAEETMRYGMRQFQEQNQSTDFMGDDAFGNDPYALDSEMTPADSVVGSPLLSYPPPLPPQYSYNNVDEAGHNNPYGMASGNVPSSGNGANSEYGNSYPKVPSYATPTSTTLNSAMRLNGKYGSGVGSVGVGGGNFSGPGVGVGLGAGLGSHGLGENGSYHPPPPAIGSNPAHMVSASGQNYPGASAASKSRLDNTNRPKPSSRLVKGKYKLFLQIQTPDRALLPSVSTCELCSTPVSPDDTMSLIYRLCALCYADPYARTRVLSDYNDFLLKLVHDKEYLSYTYISELLAFSIESIFNSRPITTEEQFRRVLMDSFTLIYVDPVLGLLAPLKFTRVSNNVSEVNNSQPVVSKHSQQLYYLFSTPLRVAYSASSDAEKTRVELMFFPETNLMLIKKKTQTVAPTYTSSFLRQLDDQWQKSGLGLESAPLDVYSKVAISIGREQFVRDFNGIVSQIKALRVADKTALNGIRPGLSYSQLGKTEPMSLAREVEKKEAHAEVLY